jgi:hypothetical protein
MPLLSLELGELPNGIRTRVYGPPRFRPAFRDLQRQYALENLTAIKHAGT